MPFARYQALTPAAYPLTIARSRRPVAPCARSASSWFERNASASALGTNVRPERARASGSTPGHVERGDPRRAADELEQEPAIRRGDPARAECDVGLGLAGDVGDAEAVPHDRHAGARPLALPGLVRSEPERRGLEEAPQVPLGHGPAERGQPVVELRLVGRVPVEGEASVLARRKDAPAAPQAPRSRASATPPRAVRAPARACRREHDAPRRHADARAAAYRSPATGPKVQSSDRGGRSRIRRDARLRAALGGARPPLSRTAQAGAPRLGRRSRRLRRRGRSARLGCRRGLERGRVPRLLPRRRAADRAVARSRLAAPRRAALGRTARARLHGPRDRGRARRSARRPRSQGRTFPTRRTCSSSGPRAFSRSRATRSGRWPSSSSRWRAIRRRPLGNALILAGVGVAALGSGLAGLGVGALAPILAIAAVLLYAGFVLPTRRP